MQRTSVNEQTMARQGYLQLSHPSDANGLVLCVLVRILLAGNESTEMLFL